jgi:hypothetical protein
MSKQVPIPKGATFTVTSGCYSDFMVQGVFLARAEIDVERLRDEWLAAHPEQNKQYSFNDSGFLASMAALMEPIESWELHLCDYSNADEIRVSQPC